MSGPTHDDTNRRSGYTPPFGLGADLEADLQCAVSTTSPVLISAAPDMMDTIAARIHRQGPNRKAPFLIIDCARTHHPEQLEVAFSAAEPRGTVFLRDVERLSPVLQAQLYFRIVPLGVRVIAGTGINLLDAAAVGAFDERLFYRLNQIHLIASQPVNYSGTA